MSHIAYSDESYITGSRFRGICSFSFERAHAAAVRERLTEAVASSGLREFKWAELKDARYKFCAIKLVEAVIGLLGAAGARVDVLVWDTQDSRHSVRNRDDGANFERMFFHLLRASMRRRGKNRRWSIFPDERLGVDWRTVADCLRAVGRQREVVSDCLFGRFLADPYYTVEDFQQVRSHEHPASQVADLMAGLGVFSVAEFGRYASWSEQTGTPSLFPEPDAGITNRQRYRFEVLRHMKVSCDDLRLGVSLTSSRGLLTRDPKRPLNFWRYVPQHPADRAPTRA